MIAPGIAAAQARPYTLTDVLQLVQAGLPSSSILTRAKKACIDFKVTSDVESVLRGANADTQLITGLRGTCYRGAEPTHIPTNTVVRKKTVVEPTVTPDDTLPVIYDYDFAVDRDAPVEADSICRYNFDLGAYTVSKRPGGHTCGTTGAIYLGDARIELHLTMISGPPHFEAGIKFGVPADGNTYYAFQINEAGSFSLWRLVQDGWVTLIPRTPSRFVKTGSNVTNVLAVRAEGRSVTLYANGEKVGTYYADAPVTGKAGLGFFGTDGDATVLFRRLRALGQRLPDPIVTPPVTTVPAVSVPVDIDFHTFKGASVQSDSTCERGYSADLYYLRRPSGSNRECGTYWQVPDTSATEVIEASFAAAQFGEPYSYGIAFGDESGIYHFEIQSSGGVYRQGLVQRGRGMLTWVTPDAENAAIDHTGNNRMRVEIRNSGVAMYINNTLVATYDPPVRIRGKRVGLVQLGDKPGTLFVNSLRITQSTP